MYLLSYGCCVCARGVRSNAGAGDGKPCSLQLVEWGNVYVLQLAMPYTQLWELLIQNNGAVSCSRMWGRSISSHIQTGAYRKLYLRKIK